MNFQPEFAENFAVRAQGADLHAAGTDVADGRLATFWFGWWRLVGRLVCAFGVVNGWRGLGVREVRNQPAHLLSALAGDP